MTREQACQRADFQGYDIDNVRTAQDCQLFNTGLPLTWIVVFCLISIAVGFGAWWSTRRRDG